MKTPFATRTMSATSLAWAVSLLGSLALDAATASKSKPTPEQIEFFEKKIRPVLAESCYKCHSEEKDVMKSELVLDTRDGIRAGGERGPAVIPKNVEDSLLITALHYEGRIRMPPEKHGGKLPDEVIADFEAWVKMGAPDPRESANVAKSEPAKPEREYDWDKERQFWAFQRPKEQSIPKVANDRWPRTEVDRFVLAKLEAKDLKPVADADKRTLVRRVYYDLTGLPPSVQEVEAFVKDRSPDAYPKLVDRLIASTRFGEQWGRHWLDVARYGESTGLDRNLNFPYAWRYRDYVIKAVNADKPYNRFIQEQVAGDLLPASDLTERDELLTATGFLAVGPKGLNEGRPKYSKWQVVDDQIDATTRGFLGLTVSCARCHDHKFDPIPTRDYHALAGIFASTDTLYGTVGGRGNRRPTSLLALSGSPELPVRFTREPTPNMFQNTNANFGATGGTNRNFARGGNGTNGFGRRGFRGQAATNQIERIPAREAYAMGVKDLDEPIDVPVYFRGDLRKPKEVVPRGFLRAVALKDTPKIPEDRSGRLELAQWLSSPENPLTARVAVNRAWQHLFGEGIVSTADNFGKLGSQPTHPELLDHLAIKFATQQGWSLKKLVRELVLSRTYQLSSAVDEKAKEADPANTLLWRATPRRLTAESLRDSLLAVSHRLDLSPPQIGVAGEFGDGYYGVNIWESDFPQDFRKRSVYLPIVRDMVPEALSLFDFPNPNLVGANREKTISPSQALFLMNNALVQDSSLQLARQLLNEKRGSAKDRIREVYQAILLREPTPAELKRARQFIEDQVQLLSSIEPEKVAPKTFSEPQPQTPAAVPARSDAPAVAAGSGGETPAVQPPAEGGRPRRQQPLGPGSASATAVMKLAPGIAQPKVYKQAEAEKPANPQEGAWSLFSQSLFASAEFRYLQ
jgi:hypothetical protein